MNDSCHYNNSSQQQTQHQPINSMITKIDDQNHQQTQTQTHPYTNSQSSSSSNLDSHNYHQKMSSPSLLSPISPNSQIKMIKTTTTNDNDKLLLQYACDNSWNSNDNDSESKSKNQTSQSTTLLTTPSNYLHHRRQSSSRSSPLSSPMIYTSNIVPKSVHHHTHPHSHTHHLYHRGQFLNSLPSSHHWIVTTVVWMMMMHLILLLSIINVSTITVVNGQQLQVTSSPPPPIIPLPPSSSIISDDFSPLVTARCDRGIMYITIVTAQPFWGVAHVRDQRKSPCLVTGTGETNTTLKISLLTQPGDELHCGVQRYKGERSVSLAVRPHKSLELSEDRFFYLTCHTNAKNIHGGTYRVNLKLVDTVTGEKVTRLLHGEPYALRAELTPKDSITTLRMKNCFVFGKSTEHVELIDRSGCPATTRLISSFVYNDSSTGQAIIPEMFKFADEAKVHFQCDALLCREGCDEEPDCEGTSKNREFELDGYSQVSTSTSAFIREPSDSDALEDKEKDTLECTEWRFPWLITLCICLAIMLLVMLLLNLFMCSSMTCRCIKTEANEKEPVDEFDDYDPYRADWTAPNSLHGSRYSLENARREQQYGGGHHHQRPLHRGDGGYASSTTTGDDDRNTIRSEVTDGGHTGGGIDNDSYIPDRQYIGNPNYTPHQKSLNRSRRSVRSNTTGSTSDDDDEENRRYGGATRPDSRFSTDSPPSMRPIRPKEIDYSFDRDDRDYHHHGRGLDGYHGGGTNHRRY